MTVPVQTPVANHIGNGVTTAFAFGFKLLNEADLIVSVNGVEMSLGIDYSVEGVDVEAGGTVTFSTAPAALAQVDLVRRVALNRLTDYQYSGDFESPAVNRDFDRLVMMLQDSGIALANAVRFPPGDASNGALPFAAARALQVLGFDAAGNITLVPATAGDATALALALASATLPTQGSAMVAYKSTAVGAVERSVLEKLGDLPSVKDFGAVGDGVVNDAPAIQAAINATSGALYFPPGNYKLGTGLSWTKSDMRLIGAGQGSTTLTCTFATGDIISIGDGAANPNNTVVSGFSITSSVVRSAGAAVRVQNGHNITIEKMRLDTNMFWGFRFDGGAQQFIYRLDDFEINSGAIGVIVGQSGGTVQDMFINNGIIYGMSSAGIMLLDASGVYSSQVDCVACFDGLTTFPGPAQTVRYCFFTQGVMDTCNNNGWNFTSNGGIVAEISMDNCWGASCGVATNGHGLFIGAVSGATRAFAVSTSRFINNRGSGIRLGNSLKTTFSNCQCIANSTQGAGLDHGMHIEAGVQFWSVIGGVFGDNGVFGTSNNQGYGIRIATGASDNYNITGAIVAQNVTGGIFDGGSGTNKKVSGCIGYKTSAVGVGEVAVGTNTVTVNHGLAAAPSKQEVALTFLTNAGASGIASCHVESVTATDIVVNTNTNAVTNPLFIGWQARVKGV